MKKNLKNIIFFVSFLFFSCGNEGTNFLNQPLEGVQNLSGTDNLKILTEKKNNIKNDNLELLEISKTLLKKKFNMFNFTSYGSFLQNSSLLINRISINIKDLQIEIQKISKTIKEKNNNDIEALISFNEIKLKKLKLVLEETEKSLESVNTKAIQNFKNPALLNFLPSFDGQYNALKNVRIDFEKLILEFEEKVKI